MKRCCIFISLGLIFALVGMFNGFIQARDAQEARETVSPPAQESTAAPGPAPVPTETELAPTELPEMESFLDGVMVTHLDGNKIAGAVVSIVKDGKMIFSKGYGFADVEKKIPVLADKTIFRTGSTGKLITWTAVMQLVEKGLIDLDADINTYLKDFKIPGTFPEPITMKHLFTHTPGFEDRFTGLGARDPKDIVPLGKYLAEHMPARVSPPGKLAAYSNYGASLAGYIVEVVSGLPFEKYVEENIFNPLDMMSSTFVQPLPAPLAENMSRGYEFKNGLFEAQDFELINGMNPAGSMSCTAVDMTKFMLAHLNHGEYEGHRILKEETAKQMHSRLFTDDPKTNGMAYGFMEYHYNDLRIIAHGGDTIYFHSLLALIPAKNLGLFVAYNTTPGQDTRLALLKLFLDRYYPLPGSPGSRPIKLSMKELERFAGSYDMTRKSFTTFEKVSGFFPPVNINVTNEGTLLINSKQWVPIEPLVFREIGGQDTLVFKEDPTGKITHAFLSYLPFLAFYKVEGIDNPFFHYVLLVICGLLFLSTWRWPAAAFFGKLCAAKDKKEIVKAPVWARLLAGMTGTFYLLALIGLVISLSNLPGLMFGDGIPFLKIVLVLPIICIALTLGVLFYTFKAWFNHYWTPCQRFHYTLVALASLVFLWFLNYWNLLGFKI